MEEVRALKTNNDIMKYLIAAVESDRDTTEFVSKLIELKDRNAKIRKTLPGICDRISKRYTGEVSKENPEYKERWTAIRTVLQDSSTTGGTPLGSNLFIQSVNIITDQKQSSQVERLEFDPVSGKVITDPLENLIIEEVDVSQYT